MENITLTINGHSVTASKGKTILEVVHENNLDKIPTLCHDPRIEPYGSCFLCVVQVEGMNKLVPACATIANNGMVIQTNNEKIRESRKSVIELLMSNHYADCIGPCINNCPASVDAQGYIALIAEGKYEEALKLIKLTNPLPLSIGRVCVRNCEEVCRRCFVEDPIGINFLKRFVADKDNNNWMPDKKAPNGKKVAIVGGGPAGLTCAYYLTLEGYSPTIFEKLPELGGMLRYGIPEYRLPKEIMDSEIQWILDQGISVKKNVEMGKDIFINQLKESGFGAIFLSVGAHKATAMGLEGENQIQGVYKGIDYLREVETLGASKMKGTAIIVGGGNTAIDAARTALRCGADNVKIVYRRSLKEMPAHFSEVEAAQEEGVEILFLTLPKNIIAEDGKLKAIECLKMQLEEAKPGERPRPVVVPGSEFTIDCDYLISAIGQQVDLSFIQHEPDCKLERWGTVIVNNETYETSIQGVFAGGDVVNGPLTAVSAIGQGKKAAAAIDEYLKTGYIKKKNKKFYSFKHRFGELPDSEFAQFEKVDRAKMPEIPISDRQFNFKEVELGLTEEQIIKEAFRCLECGCSEYYDCDFRKYGDEFNIDISDYLGDVRKFKIDSRHPYIEFDPNKCINCGKCVRTCSEILDVSALGFVNRGFKSVVKTAMEKPLLETNCITCGNCIDVCPTGAIVEKLPFRRLGTLPKTNHQTVCNYCSLGCNINFKVLDDDLFFVSNSTEEIINTKNDGYLCVKGRFGYRHLLENNRIKSPSIRENGEFVDVNMNEAISFSSNKIKEIVEKYGPESVAVFASPKMTNEELYLIQKLARAGIKTNNITSLSNLFYGEESDCLDDYYGATVSTSTIDDIKNTDVIIVMNADMDDNMIMELKIKAALKRGVKLIVISSSETNLTKRADLWIDSRKGTNTILINGIINELLPGGNNGNADLKEIVSKYDRQTISEFTGVSTEKYRKLIELMKDNKTNITFVYNLDSIKEKSKNDLKSILNFMSITKRTHKENNGLIILREFSNSTGSQDMGINPQYLPGYVKFSETKEINRIGNIWNTDLSKVFKPTDIEMNLLQGKIKAVLIFGENPLAEENNRKYFNDIEFLMVMDAFGSETAMEADVVLPITSYIEQHGTYTSCDTMIQKVIPVMKNKNNLENWQIISKLVNNFIANSNYDSFEQLFREIRNVNRIYNKCGEGDYWNKNKNNIEFFKNQKEADYLYYDIDMTTLNPNKPTLHYSDNYFIKRIKSSLTVF